MNNLKKFIEFDTGEYKLVRYNNLYLNEAFEIYNDIETVNWAGISAHNSLSDTETFISAVQASTDNFSFLFWAVISGSTGKLLGDVSLKPDFLHKYASIGTVINKEHRNRGIMTTATLPVLWFAFNILNLNRVEAQICTQHPASIRYIEKLGFKNEGLLRENFIINDKVYNSFMFSVLKTEFKLTIPPKILNANQS